MHSRATKLKGSTAIAGSAIANGRKLPVFVMAGNKA